MSESFEKINKRYLFYPFLMLVFGIGLGYIIRPSGKPKKEYPIEVRFFYQSGGYYYNDYMDADSVHKDTIWRDGVYITNKNIITSFKR